VVVVDGGNNFLNRSSSIKLKKELKRLLSLLIMDFRTRVALHLEARPIPLEAHRMKFQPLLGSRPASTTHYLRLYRGLIFSFVKALIRAKKPCQFNKYSKILRI